MLLIPPSNILSRNNGSKTPRLSHLEDHLTTLLKFSDHANIRRSMESYGPIRIFENMSKTFTLRSGEPGITVYPGVMMRPEAKRAPLWEVPEFQRANGQRSPPAPEMLCPKKSWKPKTISCWNEETTIMIFIYSYDSIHIHSSTEILFPFGFWIGPLYVMWFFGGLWSSHILATCCPEGARV